MPYILTAGVIRAEFLRLSFLLAQSPDPYLLAASLLRQLLPVAEEVLARFDERLAGLETIAVRQDRALYQETMTGTSPPTDFGTAAFADFLYEVEFGELLRDKALDTHGIPGVPLLAYALLKVAMEIDWRQAALRGSDPGPEDFSGIDRPNGQQSAQNPAARRSLEA